jgi:methyltransferase
VTAAEIILALVTAQRGLELVLARRNTKALMANGAIEIGAGHYPLLVVLHASWLIALWLLGRDQPVNAILLVVYLALEALRVWVMATLGARWTTRIIVLPNAPLVSAGPYRYLHHPNYAVVAGEIAVLPLMLNLTTTAVVFSVLNALVLLIRIRAENQGLASADALDEQGTS